MSKTVKLTDIVDAIDSQMEGHFQYLNRKTGEIVSVSEEDLAAAENEDESEEHPEWQHEAIETARQIISNEEHQFIELPTSFDVNDYSIMEDFCRSVKDPNISNKLLSAINGRGAFRMFKERIDEFDIKDEWYSFREEALTEIAREWCEEYKILYE